MTLVGIGSMTVFAMLLFAIRTDSMSRLGILTMWASASAALAGVIPV